MAIFLNVIIVWLILYSISISSCPRIFRISVKTGFLIDSIFELVEILVKNNDWISLCAEE